MLEVIIPGWRALQLEHLVMDLNGTLSVDGHLIPGIAAALEALRPRLRLLLVTADTHGTGAEIARQLGIHWLRLTSGNQSMQKQQIVRELGADRVVAIGNGANDVDMLREAALAIAVINGEGAASLAILAADILVASALDGLALLQHPQRLIATLRRA